MAYAISINQALVRQVCVLAQLHEVNEQIKQKNTWSNFSYVSEVRQRKYLRKIYKNKFKPWKAGPVTQVK